MVFARPSFARNYIGVTNESRYLGSLRMPPVEFLVVGRMPYSAVKYAMCGRHPSHDL